jgi:mono/diheme cytochrome c family protein
VIRAGILLVLTLLLVPPAARAADERELYARHCVVCHGVAGRGDGPAAGLLWPRPRDFTTGRYKLRSTEAGTLPSASDVARTISRGLPGTSMAGYRELLSSDDIARVARFVLALAPAGARAGRVIALPPAPDDTPGARRRGAAAYTRLGCPTCHGAEGRPGPWRPEREGPGGPTPPADLSAPWTFRGGDEPAAVAMRILTGLDGSAMPGYAAVMDPREAWEIAYHVRALGRAPAWLEADPEKVTAVGVAADPLERGRYLVNAMLCALCHTPISPRDGAYDTRFFLAGGMRVSAYPWGVWYSRNLTPDPETGLGRWSEEEISRAVTRGVARDGHRLDPMAMPWPWFSQLAPGDARAVAAYLKALPPIANAVPEPTRAGPAEAVGGKLMVLLGAEASVDFWGGNAALDPALRDSVPAPPGRRALAASIGYAMLALGVAGLALAVRGRRGRWLVLSAALGLLAGWAVLAMWPPLALMSPEATTKWLLLRAPGPPDALGGRERALVERGRYVATIAPCGLCHTPAGAFIGFYSGRTLAGGMEARWRVYGRAVSSNLTPHRDGIAPMGDDTLLRAMRSGIGSDGRAMHWQAMPWDIGSRWSEEDRRALLAYLRALPPVAGKVAAPRSPGPDDPPADAFYWGDAARR